MPLLLTKQEHLINKNQKNQKRTMGAYGKCLHNQFQNSNR